MIPFTCRELVRAWRNATAASCLNPRTNSHRLLLFYAVECGLKAAYLKRQKTDPLDGQTAATLMHDLNRILDKVNADKALRLPDQLTLQPIKNPETIRRCHIGELNQIWRYGGELEKPKDHEIEQHLETIQLWIAKELQ